MNDESPPVKALIAIAISVSRADDAATQVHRRYLRRQYHRRRRDTTSSLRSSRSAPYSDGAGISLWASTSISPRKAAMPSSVPTSAHANGHSARS